MSARFAQLLPLVWFLACQQGVIPEVRVDFDAGVVRSRPSVPRQALRVSVAAMLSPTDTFDAYQQLVTQLAEAQQTRGELVQRRTYRETNELLNAGAIDLAFICTGGLLDLELSGRAPRLLAVPVVRGAMTYESAIIVPAASPVSNLTELAGQRFAFTDELSLSGYAWPVWLIRQTGRDPRRFFLNTYFTHSHDRSIEAVAKGVVEGAAVDSVILVDMLRRSPQLSKHVRVLMRSQPFGMPPVVAGPHLDEQLFSRVREWLLHLHERPEGVALLERLGFDRFAEPSPGLYAEAMEVVRGSRP